MKHVTVLAVAVLLVGLRLASARLVPEGFSCSRDMPRGPSIYSTPDNANSVKVDVIHVFCGQVSDRYGVGGFHARPGDVDPDSASTFSIYMSRRPANELECAIYKKPLIFDAREGEFVSKRSSSSVWPTALSMEELTWTITYLVDECRYVTLKVRNPHVYSQIWFRHTYGSRLSVHTRINFSSRIEWVELRMRDDACTRKQIRVARKLYKSIDNRA